MDSGVYYILNNITNKTYCGRSNNISRRWKEHILLSQQENRKEYNYPLYRAIRKYGVENFTFGIIEKVSKDLLYEKEQHWYKILKPEYNQTHPEDVYLYNNKEIYQIDLQSLKILNKFNSVIDAANTFNVSSRSIAQVARKETISSSGFYWSFAEDYNDRWKPKNHGNAKIILQKDPYTQKIINKYNSAKIAAQAMNVSKTAIIRACNKLAKTSCGFIWEYEGSE